MSVSKNSIRFTYEGDGQMYYAMCCKDIFESHTRILIGIYGGPSTCIGCRRNTSCSKHVNSPGGSRIILDDDNSLQVGNKNVKE